MTRYLSITPIQEPFDLGDLDDGARVQYAVNFLALKQPSTSFLREVISILEAAGVGVEGQTIFASSLATVPREGTVLHLQATGGTAPLGTHNEGQAALRRPGLQIIVRSPSELEASTMANAAYDALVAVRNLAVSA